MFVTQLILSIPPLLAAVILHEIAHALAALRLGDRTAKDLGRITLNPFKHIDPMLTVALPLILILIQSPVIFGGAKPVPVNPLNFRSPRKDMALVAIAGPVTNFVLAALSVLLLYIIPDSGSQFVLLFRGWCLYSVIINIALGLFNLIPIPPLDGGRIMVGILPLHLARSYAQLERWGFFILFAALYSGIPQKIIAPAIEWSVNIAASSLVRAPL